MNKMIGLFDKLCIIFIYNFIFICCFIHTVYGVYSCLSFTPYNLAYARNVIIELERNLHVTLDFEDELEQCYELANINTIYSTSDGLFEYEYDDEFDEVEEIAADITKFAKESLDFFNEYGQSLQPLAIGYQRQIYNCADEAIHRLIKSSHKRFSPDSDLIKKIRKLKKRFSPRYKLKGLYIDGYLQPEVPSSTHMLFDYFENVESDTAEFMGKGITEVDGRFLLYVGQDELATTKFDDPSVRFMGSDDASTCIIAILKHTGADVYGIVHLDDNRNILAGITYLVNEVLGIAGNTQGALELYLVGGYLDSKNVGETNFFNVMEAVHQQRVPTRINLIFACVGQHNTYEDPYNGSVSPVFNGVGIDLRQRNIFPAYFSDKEPEMNIRTARIMAGNDSIINIYNHKKGRLSVGPFHYEIIPRIQNLLNMSDDEVDEELGATSEFVSPAFVEKTRSALKFLRENPYPWEVFPGNKAHYFERDFTDITYGWIRVWDNDDDDDD